MTARLASASVDVKDLLARAEKGDRVAALELATTYKCTAIDELIEVVCPLEPPSFAVFDCLADAMALKARRDQRKEVVQ